MNINGGTFWCAKSNGEGCLGIGINNNGVESTLNLNSGVLRVDTQIRSGVHWGNNNGSTYLHWQANSGTVNINGGEAYVRQFVIGADTASTGTSKLTLNGGSLTVVELNFRQYNGQVFTWRTARSWRNATTSSS